MRLVLLVVAAAACSSPRGGATGEGPTAPPAETAVAQEVATPEGHILDVDQAVVAEINKIATTHRPGHPANLCGANKPFISEIGEGGLPASAKVKYEWYPIVPGSDPRGVVLDEHHVYVAGTISAWTTPGEDVPFAHPFGNDCSADIVVDEPYENLVYDGPEPPGMIHAELESGLFPHLRGDDPAGCGNWITPTTGDRIVELGDWIMDCGHPESYGSEIHPPVVMAIGHLADDGTHTEMRAFAIPYRTTQLYSAEGDKAARVDDIARFDDKDVKPFPDYFQSELLRNAFSEHDHIVVHPVIERARFDAATWTVCAPPPRPANAAGVAVDWHFTTRTGVSVTATKHDDRGCVTFTATESPSYASQPVARKDRPWPWCNADPDGMCNAWSVDRMAQDKTGDCKQNVRDLVEKIAYIVATLVGGEPHNAQGAGIAWAVIHGHLDNTPVIDQYDPLLINAGEGADCLGKCRRQREACVESDDPQVIKRCVATYRDCVGSCRPPTRSGPNVAISDAQPFPFFGTATVSWTTSGAAPAVARSVFAPAELNWKPSAADVQRVTLQNVGNAPLPVVAVGIEGGDRLDFAIANDACSGKQFAADESCMIDVRFKRSQLGPVARAAGWHRATLTVATDTPGALPSIPLAGWDGPICVPTRTTCDGGHTCDIQDNGCGGWITCGTCAAGMTCTMEAAGGRRCMKPLDACRALCATARSECQTSHDPATKGSCASTFNGCTAACAHPPSPFQPSPTTPPLTCQSPRVELSPAVLAWTAADGSANKTAKVTDISPRAVVVTKVSIQGTDAKQFAIATDSCTGKRLPVPAGHCGIDVAYSPTIQAGTPEATLVFEDEAAGSPQSVLLHGPCTPRSSCVRARCGTQDDGCGTGTIMCGTCGAGDVCTSAGQCARAASRGACTTKCQQAREACVDSGDPQLVKRCVSTYRNCVAACPR